LSFGDVHQQALGLGVLQPIYELAGFVIVTDGLCEGDAGLDEHDDPHGEIALHREVEEEVGIELEEVGVELGSLSVGHPMRRMEVRVQPWVYGLRVKPMVSIGSEIAGSFWANLADLPSTKKMSEITIRNQPWSVESFVVEGKVVWGFTYRVLTELLPILEISL